MKVALPIAGGELCMHFGHCESFYLFEVNQETKKIISVETMVSPPHEPGLLPRLLSEKGVHIVLAGGMGSRAKNLFGQKGIQVVVGANPANGTPEDLVRQYLAGSLQTGANICDH